jgi:protein TonB
LSKISEVIFQFSSSRPNGDEASVAPVRVAALSLSPRLPVPINPLSRPILFLLMKTPSLLLAACFCLFSVSAQAAATPGRENPVPVRTVAPEYPREMKQNGVSGLVMVKCMIDEQGNVSQADVVKSSDQTFDKFATEALKKWKFKPARQDGTPIAMQVTIPIKFVAEES